MIRYQNKICIYIYIYIKRERLASIYIYIYKEREACEAVKGFIEVKGTENPNVVFV